MAKPTIPIYPGITRRLRRIPVHEVPKLLFQGPPNADAIKIHCQCGTVFSPPWGKPLEFEYAPLQSKDGGIWVFSGLPLSCPNCSVENEFKFPSVKSRGSIHLYADEAGEWFGNDYFHVYAFVGVRGDIKKKIDDSLTEAKKTLRPDDDPKSWYWHTWEIRNTRWRRANNVRLQIGEIDAVIRSVVESLSGGLDKRLLSAIVCPPLNFIKYNRSKNKILSDVRDQTLTAGIIGLTELCTRNGLKPNFTIESQTPAYRDNQIDYFVERIGRGLYQDLGFHYVCRGRNIGLPDTAPKGSCLELELADLIAYIVRRFYFTANSGIQTEFPLDLLGTVFWGFLSPTGLETKSQVGFPWKKPPR